MTQVLGYICEACHKYRNAREYPWCPCKANDMVVAAPFQVLTFKPYQETNAPDQPVFQTRQERDNYLLSHGFSYDTYSHCTNQYEGQPLVDAKTVDKIMATEGDVKLPVMTEQDEKNLGRTVHV